MSAPAVSGTAGLPETSFDRPVWSVLGLPVDAVSLEEAEAIVRAAALSRRRLTFVTPNLNWLVRALREPEAMRQVREADLSLADGAPVVWLARRLGAPMKGRVAGADLFQRLRRNRPGERPLRVFFFGGRPGAAEKAAETLNAEEGGLIGCGHLNPGYGDVASMSAPVMIETINRARPDFLVVALGAAKGQAWISANQFRLNAPVITHLGAVIDFTAGTIPRAPAWMADNGLEWLWRIGAETSLWRRYLSDGLALLRLVPGRLWPLQRDLRLLPEAGQPADAWLDTRSAAISVHVTGDAKSGALAPVRAAFAKAAGPGRDVRLELGALGAFDQAFIGLVLRLEARLARSGARLFITGPGKLQAYALESNGLAGLMQAGPPAPANADTAPGAFGSDRAA